MHVHTLYVCLLHKMTSRLPVARSIVRCMLFYMYAETPTMLMYFGRHNVDVGDVWAIIHDALFHVLFLVCIQMQISALGVYLLQ